MVLNKSKAAYVYSTSDAVANLTQPLQEGLLSKTGHGIRDRNKIDASKMIFIRSMG